MNIDNITSDGIALTNNGKEMLIKVYEQEIKRLKEEYVMLQNASDKVEEEKDREIERLNNIINELEKWLEEYISLLKEPDIYEEQTLEDLKEVLDKLQELKGSDKE